MVSYGESDDEHVGGGKCGNCNGRAGDMADMWSTGNSANGAVGTTSPEPSDAVNIRVPRGPAVLNGKSGRTWAIGHVLMGNGVADGSGVVLHSGVLYRSASMVGGINQFHGVEQEFLEIFGADRTVLRGPVTADWRRQRSMRTAKCKARERMLLKVRESYRRVQMVCQPRARGTTMVLR